MDHTTLNPSTITSLIQAAPVLYNIKTHTGHPSPLVLLGSPGSSKSAQIKDQLPALLAPLFGGRTPAVLTEELANKDPMEINGLAFPLHKDRPYPVTVYTKPSLIERIERCHQQHGEETPIILFLDEIMQADTLVQRPLANLLHEHQIGEWPLPKNVWIWAAGNFTSDGAGSNKVLSHVVNRLPFYHVYLPVEDWVGGYAVPNNLPAPLSGYALQNKEELQFPSAEHRKAWRNSAFLTYRSLAMAGHTIRAWLDAKGVKDERQIPDDTLLWRSIEGRIGMAHANALRAYYSMAEDLPLLDDIFRDPHTAKVPERMDAQFIVATMLSSHVKRIPESSRSVKQFEQCQAAGEYIVRLSVKDLAVKAIIDMNKKLLGSQATQRFVFENTALISRAYD